MSTVSIPVPSLVLLVGVSGSGKSTFARQHFSPTEVVSSDFCRALVSDDENNQDATGSAFEVLHTIVAERLRLGRLTVVDATNVERHARRPLVELGRRFHATLVAIVLDLPIELCLQRNSARRERTLSPEVILRQHANLESSMPALRQEGFDQVVRLCDNEALDRLAICHLSKLLDMAVVDASVLRFWRAPP